MAANSLRPQVLLVMAAHRERPPTTEEIYEQVAASGVSGFDPTAKRDRNLVNRELSDLAGCSAGSHSKPSPQLLVRVSRGRYIFNELNRPMDLALVQEYLEPQEVYEKRPPRRRGEGSHRETVPEALHEKCFYSDFSCKFGGNPLSPVPSLFPSPWPRMDGLEAWMAASFCPPGGVSHSSCLAGFGGVLWSE